MFFIKVSLFSLLALIIQVSCNDPVKVISLEDCPVEKNALQKGFEMVFALKDGGVSGHLTLPFDIDDSIEFEVSAQEMKDGKWVDGDFNLQGSFCEGYQMYMPKVAAKLIKLFKLKEACPIPAGKYEINDFVIEKDEIELPAGPDFHYKMRVVYKKDEVPIACRFVELKN